MNTDGQRSHDVLIVGGGGAGLRAAISIAETEPGLSVAVVSKVYPMRSHTVSAEGGAAAVASDEDSLEDHIYDTLSGGEWLCDQDAVEAFVNEARAELLQLEHWGCPWSRNKNGTVAVRSFGGMSKDRTWFAADKTGFHMLHTMFQHSLRHDPIKRYDEFFVIKLLVKDGQCHGVSAIELATGKVVVIAAKSVILCTGGCGQVFQYTTNGSIKTGDGMALAFRAGVALKDMEFIQYHPTGLTFSGILITEAARSEGGHLLNKDNYRYLQDYGLGHPEDTKVRKAMELGPRDRLSQAFAKEEQKGNTVDSPYGPYVKLDIKHLGREKILEKLPLVRELCLKFEKLDPVDDYIPVRPVVHYMMGGIDVDINGATSVKGLYAAGEAACVSLHGANRLGSNSLTELLVFGARAGKAAAEFARQQPESLGRDFFDSGEEERYALDETYFKQAKGSNSSDTVASIRKEMQSAMQSGAGIYRTQESIKATQKTLQELQERMKHLTLQDRTYTFNTELMAAIELGYLLDVAGAIVQSALHRTESRGSHQREDYPEANDDAFLKHSLVYYKKDALPSIDYKDVNITRWEPEQRTYGQDKSATQSK